MKQKWFPDIIFHLALLYLLVLFQGTQIIKHSLSVHCSLSRLLKSYVALVSCQIHARNFISFYLCETYLAFFNNCKIAINYC